MTSNKWPKFYCRNGKFVGSWVFSKYGEWVGQGIGKNWYACCEDSSYWNEYYKPNKTKYTFLCSNGTPVKVGYCPSREQAIEDKCEFCDPGYDLVDEKCVLRKCSCPGHGLGTEGIFCGSSGISECVQCDYEHLNVESGCQCTDCNCTCEFGNSNDCPLDGANFCTSCDENHELVNGNCDSCKVGVLSNQNYYKNSKESFLERRLSND